ncbi:unnamed protein product [Arctia plantaginis]|uniref:Odorant-binding protein n=1 Tax=Arctia plantaginis TaxID=874455 RepID=A0A8S1B201_ARCPL|nr:unnamed protein product [Arctia plantaginis]
MDENGMLSPQEAQKKAELLLKENYSQLNNDEDLIRICSAVNKVVTDDGPEGCDRAKLIYECLIENGPKAISLTEQTIIRTKLFAVALECIQSNPLTFTQIKSFKNNIVPDQRNAKCFTACLYKKIGLMDDMGMLSPASARKQAEIVFKEDEETLKNVDRIMQHCLYGNLLMLYEVFLIA